MSVEFFVAGIPQPQGSAKAFVVKGRAIVTSDNTRLKPWRAQLAGAAQDAMHGRDLFEQAVVVSVNFIMPRPKSLPKTKPRAHTVKPDIDKLVRSTLDALTGVVFRDDSLVVQVNSRKQYAAIGQQSGAYVWVQADAITTEVRA